MCAVEWRKGVEHHNGKGLTACAPPQLCGLCTEVTETGHFQCHFRHQTELFAPEKTAENTVVSLPKLIISADLKWELESLFRFLFRLHLKTAFENDGFSYFFGPMCHLPFFGVRSARVHPDYNHQMSGQQ
jgi:hypothetical protein